MPKNHAIDYRSKSARLAARADLISALLDIAPHNSRILKPGALYVITSRNNPGFYTRTGFVYAVYIFHGSKRSFDDWRVCDTPAEIQKYINSDFSALASGHPLRPRFSSRF